MALSSDLLSQLVKATKPVESKPTESTVYGTTVEQGGDLYVQIDGSDVLTPVSSTVKMESGERVIVSIKNHTATVMGNLTTQAARSDDVDDIVDEIAEFEIIIADKVSVEEFDAANGRIDNLVSDNVLIRGSLTAAEASIADLEADNVVINDKLTANEAAIEVLETTSLTADIAELKYATIGDLDAVNAVIYTLDTTYATIDELDAIRASIDDLDVIRANIVDLETTKLSAEQAALKYANIDFSNIGEAAIEKLFSDSGIIKDLIVSEGKITGELVGVTIKGDLIEAGTLKADKLVVKGSDGIYYKLNVEAGAVASEEVTEQELQNGLHGTAIIAKTITAEKIAVDDLVAFDATIGGFNITTESLYSGTKSSADNTTRGVYLDKDGQLSVGDSDNFLRYYKTEDGTYKLEISADSLVFSTSGKTVEQVIEDNMNFEIGARNLIRNSKNLIFSDYGFLSANTTAIVGRAIVGQAIVGRG